MWFIRGLRAKSDARPRKAIAAWVRCVTEARKYVIPHVELRACQELCQHLSDSDPRHERYAERILVLEGEAISLA